jgi:hypothetical protein
VASPAPLTGKSAALLAAVHTADLPGAQLRREDSVGGQPGTAAVHVLLADGTPVEVLAQQLQEPPEDLGARRRSARRRLSRVQFRPGPADDRAMSTEIPAHRTVVPCDRDHLDQLRAPSSDVAVPNNPAALQSIAALLTHTSTRPA